jgi:uncharacterized membrane protein
VTPPWEYLFTAFSSRNFPDLFHPTWIASLVLLVGLIILYTVRTRQLRGHAPYLQMYEWMLWTGIVTFGLLLVGALFVFDFFLVLAFGIIGLSFLVWVRFRKFPPVLELYEQRLAKQRYFTRSKFTKPEATIRPKTARRSRRRR